MTKAACTHQCSVFIDTGPCPASTYMSVAIATMIAPTAAAATVPRVATLASLSLALLPLQARLQVAFAVQQFAKNSVGAASAFFGSLYLSEPQAITFPAHCAVLAVQQSTPALQLAASDRHLVVSTPVFFLEPGGHVAELQVALAVQQLVSNALDGAARAFFGSLYLSRGTYLSIPEALCDVGSATKPNVEYNSPRVAASCV